MRNNETTQSSIGFTGLLTILFIGLKLGKVIDWPWLWVLSPIWISIALVLAIMAIVFLVLALREFAKK